MELVDKRTKMPVEVGDTINTRSWGPVQIAEIHWPTEDNPHGKVTLLFKTKRTGTFSDYSCDLQFTGPYPWQKPEIQPTLWAVAVPFLIEASSEDELREIVREIVLARHPSILYVNPNAGPINTTMTREEYEAKNGKQS